MWHTGPLNPKPAGRLARYIKKRCIIPVVKYDSVDVFSDFAIWGHACQIFLSRGTGQFWPKHIRGWEEYIWWHGTGRCGNVWITVITAALQTSGFKASSSGWTLNSPPTGMSAHLQSSVWLVTHRSVTKPNSLISVLQPFVLSIYAKTRPKLFQLKPWHAPGTVDYAGKHSGPSSECFPADRW